MNIFFVFLGAGLGGITRYGTSTMLAGLLGINFAYGTLTVNAIGSFLIGLLAVFIPERLATLEVHLAPFLLIGFLGGMTTFSSFSLETLNLIENGQWGHAGINIASNVILSIAMAWLGIIGGRAL